jgi:hypothetical protein
MVAVVFRSPPEPGVDETGQPLVADAGYFCIDVERPTNHVWVVGPDVSWDEARLRAALSTAIGCRERFVRSITLRQKRRSL